MFLKYVRYRLVNSFLCCLQLHEDALITSYDRRVSLKSESAGVTSTIAMRHQYWVRREYQPEGANNIIQVSVSLCFLSSHHTTYVNRSKCTRCLIFVYLLNIEFVLHDQLTASLLQKPRFQCCLGRQLLFGRSVVPSKPASFFLGRFS